MSLFSNLLGRKGQTPEDVAQKQQFDEEWIQAVKRFGIVTGLGTINLELKHPKTGKVMLPHEGLGQTFSEWKPIEAPYDRRALLFDQLFNTVGQSMNRWQIANYLVANRRPDKAFALLEQAQTSETASAGYHAASAKALLSLGRPADAVIQAKKAIDTMPDYSRLRTVYADALHLFGQCEEAHTLYAQLMAMADPVTEDTASVAPMFFSLFSQETGAVPSPVLALDIVEQMSDPVQSEEFWRLGETEFYDSPYFRMHHAYHLANLGEIERGFAKLLALVREMPWQREPSLNLLVFFKRLDPTGQQIMPEVQAQLRQTIQKNGWTVEGMKPITIGTGG